MNIDDIMYIANLLQDITQSTYLSTTTTLNILPLISHQLNIPRGARTFSHDATKQNDEF